MTDYQDEESQVFTVEEIHEKPLSPETLQIEEVGSSTALETQAKIEYPNHSDSGDNELQTEVILNFRSIYIPTLPKNGFRNGEVTDQFGLNSSTVISIFLKYELRNSLLLLNRDFRSLDQDFQTT